MTRVGVQEFIRSYQTATRNYVGSRAVVIWGLSQGRRFPRVS